MNTYMDHVHEMADRTAQVAEMRRTAQVMAVRSEDRVYHGLRARLGAYLISVGRQLSETPRSTDGVQCLGPEGLQSGGSAGSCSPSAA